MNEQTIDTGLPRISNDELILQQQRAAHFAVNPDSIKNWRDSYIVTTILKNGVEIGVNQYMHTFGLCYGMDATGMSGRFCYESINDCYDAFIEATKIGDVGAKCFPDDDNWIKHKGIGGDHKNPNRNV